MNSEIRTFLADRVPRFTRALADFDRKIDPQAEPTSDSLVEDLTQCINGSLRDCKEFEARLAVEDPLVLKNVQQQYRAAIWPWFGKSWFLDRGLTKPRGYPGDYQLLSAIYDGFTKSRGLGGYLDRYFLNTTLARAVVARMWSARRFLIDELARRHGRVSILNVACGSAREYQGGFAPAADRNATITCVDNDSEALEHAQSRATGPLTKSGISSNFVRYNALRMTSANANIRRFGRSDVIYSIGLCDYIPDEYLVPLLQGWRDSLHAGGVVYVAFKDSRLYDKTEYQWLNDWYFFQRTEEEFRRLFELAGYDLSQIEATRDATGVIINFISGRTPGEMVRVDDAQQRPMPQHIEAVAPTEGHAARQR